MTVGGLFTLGFLAGVAAFGAGVLLALASAIRRGRASKRAARLQLVGLATIAATPACAMLFGTDRSLPDPVWIALVVVSLAVAIIFLLIAVGLRVGGDPLG